MPLPWSPVNLEYSGGDQFSDEPVPEYGSCSSGKNLYPRRNMAEQAARRTTARYGWVMQVYQCPDCKWFHLSKLTHKGSPVLDLEAMRRGKEEHD